MVAEHPMDDSYGQSKHRRLQLKRDEDKDKTMKHVGEEKRYLTFI
jgi:hypothetical protein